MNSNEILFLIGTILNLSSLPALLLFIGFYFIRSPWREYEAGRALMYFAVSLAALSLSGALTNVLGPEYVGREVVRIILYGAVSYTMWGLFITLRRIQKKPPATVDEMRAALESLIISKRVHPHENYQPHDAPVGEVVIASDPKVDGKDGDGE